MTEHEKKQDHRSIDARTARLQAQMAAAREMLKDKRSEAEIALDTAAERMVADVTGAKESGTPGRAQPGAEEGTAPAVHVVARRVLHDAKGPP